MVTFLRILGGLVILGVLALLAFLFVPVQRTAPTAQLPADWTPAPGQGEYVAIASDCVACHTAPDGQPFAGGRAIVSPMGTIWSTNITADKETGIGNWTLDDFRAAMVDGVTPDGTHLYPAMPYENYRLMTEEDIRALYDYLMHELPAVHAAAPKTELTFPFNLRFGIRAWNWLALSHGAGFKPEGRSELEDRGQYLVEGPAHCAACHSPRTRFMSQDGILATDRSFLTGGVIDGWNAPALRGPESAPQKWTLDELATYLATGRNAHSTANGEMGLVVEHSLQYLTDRDNLAIAAFLKGIDGAAVEVPETFAIITGAQPPAEADAAGAETERLLTEASPDMPLGARLYLDNCSACHFVTGKGAPGIFPELQANELVTGSETKPLISIILNGAEVQGTQKRPMNLVMQGYADRLTDGDVAELANFLRTAWGNDAAPVTSADVAKVRAEGVH
ncbi:c-type cytochrome [Paenirhodobacter populi]|uniref:C-type cytochrome n=1 Tax=Paenirhodobacter populi TaxID=2306993 RepID=A0A443J5B8_9RHOB|nr:c-type cytochrome [Sinirhodobacter populi]RWR15533.1 c-type cytochrome [Sinirhodobacter populi]